MRICSSLSLWLLSPDKAYLCCWKTATPSQDLLGYPKPPSWHLQAAPQPGTPAREFLSTSSPSRWTSVFPSTSSPTTSNQTWPPRFSPSAVCLEFFHLTIPTTPTNRPKHYQKRRLSIFNASVITCARSRIIS
ncbi:hypothetical protein LZ32DRAFT_393588 [Colletotrichum eremochloae]|nr:hypothetical protein LZ32DRAFT_393588 [Colletotrichum eremochloae]